MGPDNQNMGSFGTSLQGTDALRAALKKRGMSDVGILDQVSGSAPTGPSPVPPSPQGGLSPTGGQSIDQTIQPPQQGQPDQPFRSAEQALALKALAQTARVENKIAESLLAPKQPQGI